MFHFYNPSNRQKNLLFSEVIGLKWVNKLYRSTILQVIDRIGLPKTFPQLTGKHLRQSSFYSKVAVLRNFCMGYFWTTAFDQKNTLYLNIIYKGCMQVPQETTQSAFSYRILYEKSCIST